VKWDEFERACPEIAGEAVERFRRDELVMVGSLRRDGSPRISPCEVDVAAGYLFLGMMWRSPKAVDLLRDPRVVVHSVTCNREGTDGDVKIYGRAVDERDPDTRAAFREAIRARIDWAPDEPEFHLFSIDVESAASVRFDEEEQETVVTWDPDRGLRRWTKSGS
jgi:hypothetical protein